MSNMSDINILFLGGARRVSLAQRFIDSGKKLKRNVNIFSYELNEWVPIRAVAQIIVGKKWNDAQILEDIAQSIRQHNIHIVLPFVDPAISLAAQLKDKLPTVFIPISALFVCNLFFDKLSAQEWFLKNGVPVPEDQGGFPVIAKHRTGSASKDIHILKTAREKEIFFEGHDQNSYIVQRFIEGEEYTVDVYISVENRVLACVPRKRLEVIAGEVTKTVTIEEAQISALADMIFRKNIFNGPITLQFIKENKTQNSYIMEINPRFGGGVIASIEAGANIPLMILRDYFKMPNKAVKNWKRNSLMIRAHREFFYADYH